MTARADPSPLPPGVLLERERSGASPRRRGHVADGSLLVADRPVHRPPTVPVDVDLTAAETIDLTSGEFLAGPIGAEFVGTESAPNRCQGGPGQAPLEAVPGPADDEGPGLAADGPPAGTDGGAPEQPSEHDEAADAHGPAPLRFVALADDGASTPPAEDEPAPPPSAEEGTTGPAPAPAPPEVGESHSRWRVAAQVAAWAAAVGAVAVVLLVFVFPTRTYVNQRRQLAATASELRLLNSQNSQLTDEVARLRTDSEIERIAREQYHLVQPGESAIAILPAPAPAAPANPSPPPPKPHESWLHRLTSWLP